MKSKLMVSAGLLGLTAVVLASLGAGAERQRRTETQAFMRQKLLYSQGILEGLALEKFELISRDALRLRNMSHSNFWFIVKQPEYMLHTTNFYKSADALYLAAVDKKLDAATEAYVSLAKNCVECHRLVRAEQHKQATQPAP